MSEEPRVYGTGEVARRLQVSAVTARKYADALEAVRDERLPRHKRGRGGRVLTERDVELLEAAKHHADGGATVEDAVRLALGLPLETTAKPTPDAGRAALPVLADEFRQVLEEFRATLERRDAEHLAELERRDTAHAEALEALRGEVAALRADLAARDATAAAVTLSKPEQERAESPASRRASPPRRSWVARLLGRGSR